MASIARRVNTHMLFKIRDVIFLPEIDIPYLAPRTVVFIRSIPLSMRVYNRAGIVDRARINDISPPPHTTSDCHAWEYTHGQQIGAVWSKFHAPTRISPITVLGRKYLTGRGKSRHGREGRYSSGTLHRPITSDTSPQIIRTGLQVRGRVLTCA
jgi:hypothetical protein